MNDQVAEGTILEKTSQGRRRHLVVRMYLCLAVTVGMFVVASEHWWILLALMPMVYAFALYTKLIQPIAKDLTEKTDRELDERELMIRNRAYYHAYRMLSVVFGLSIAYALFVKVFFSDVNLPVPETLGAFAVLILLLAHLVVSFPASVVAWTEPDPEPEDQLYRQCGEFSPHRRA